MSISVCQTCLVISSDSAALCEPAELRTVPCDYDPSLKKKGSARRCVKERNPANYLCASCGRLSVDEELLCVPLPLER